MAKGSEQKQRKVDTDSDRFPKAKDALTRISQYGDLPDEPVERIEIHAGAGGELTFRWWPARSDDSDFGYIGPDGD
jgi:hypothetical protein